MSGCEFTCMPMRRLNRDRDKTNQIGKYTLKINSIILKLQKVSLSGEQNVAAGKKNIYIHIYIFYSDY